MEVKHLTALELKVLRALALAGDHYAHLNYVEALPVEERRALMAAVAPTYFGGMRTLLGVEAPVDIFKAIPLAELLTICQDYYSIRCENCMYHIESWSSPARPFYVKHFYCSLVGKPGSKHCDESRFVDEDGVCEKFTMFFPTVFEMELRAASENTLYWYVEGLKSKFDKVVASGDCTEDEAATKVFLDAWGTVNNDIFDSVDWDLINSLDDPHTDKGRMKAVDENKKLMAYDAEARAVAEKAMAEFKAGLAGDDL